MSDSAQWVLGFILVLSSAGVVTVRKPVHACLCFLLTLLTLAALYLQLYAQFIAVMQVLVYAGAILVIFMFVIVLFQDAHQQISRFEAQSPPALILFGAAALILSFVFVAKNLTGLTAHSAGVPLGFGTAQTLGKALYVDFFFPFEAVILLFLIALIGALYVARRVK